ncbi:MULTISPECIES: hypothetical protein [unclassified Corynebacterium]|uniref:hypothetical protein n=1 Tax=unclassified Corynebacterium TaxID=2624378 RepID=UPI00352416A2
MLGTDSTGTGQKTTKQVSQEFSAHSNVLYTDTAMDARLRAVTAPDGVGKACGSAVPAAPVRPPRCQRELASINERLSVLSAAFGNNLLADPAHTPSMSPMLRYPKGALPVARICASRNAVEVEVENGYLLTRELLTVQSMMIDFTDPMTRAALHEVRQRRWAVNPTVLLEMVKLGAHRA